MREMNKTITSWLGAVPTGLFLAAVRHSPSLYLLFISPASPCCGCMCVGGVRVCVCGRRCGVVFTRLSAINKFRIFLAAAQWCNPPTQTVSQDSQLDWQAGRAG